MYEVFKRLTVPELLLHTGSYTVEQGWEAMATGNRAITRVQTLAESGIQIVPPEYVRIVEKAQEQGNLHVPIIDLHGLNLQQRHVHLFKEQDDIIAT